MTTFLYSAIANGDSLAFDSNTDILRIDSAGFSAADFTLTVLPGDAGVQWSNDSKTFVLAGASLASLSEENVQFADGSMLVNSCLANGFSHDLSGSGHDDLLLGSPAATPVDRISETDAGDPENGSAYDVDISADGRFVVFSSGATNLGGVADTNHIDDVFLKDLQTGSLTRISTTSRGKQGVADGQTLTISPSISADGTRVAFESDAKNLVGNDINNSPDIFVRNTVTGAIIRASTSAANVQGNGESFSASISSDGRYVAFASWANNLVANDANNTTDIFVKDTLTGAVKLVSSTSSGGQSDAGPNGWGEANSAPTISADGGHVLFISTATNLVEGDNNNATDVFVKDLATSELTCVSTDIHGNVVAGGAGWTPASMSADGRFVFFGSDGPILGDGHDGHDGQGALYRRDLQTGDVVRVTEGGAVMDVSADGRFVLIQTAAALMEGDTNNDNDLYVKDMSTGLLFRASLGAAGEQTHGTGFKASMSDDGTRIVLQCTGSELVGGQPYTTSQVFVVDNPLAGWTLRGGAGDDVYQLARAGTIVEAVDGGIDTVRSSASIGLAANVEHLVLTGSEAITGLGNDLDNRITGNAADNRIDGRQGNDTLDGAGGNDTAGYADATSGVAISLSVLTAQATGGAGTDTLANFENLVGSAFADRLTGSSAANLLDGGAGADTLSGGTGNDIYVVDNAGDSIVELAGGGADTVRSSISFTLGSQLENLILLGADSTDGTGNSLANSITGNGGDNVLDGGTGADTLTGGQGSDTYVVDNTGDRIVETGFNDVWTTDTVQSSVSWTLGDNLENLTLTGSAAINGTGNAWRNVITGNDGANVLSGGNVVDWTDWDTLVGGLGDDTYIVNSDWDQTIETADGGTDTVRSSVSWYLRDETENLVLAGSESTAGYGNAKNNVMTGNAGDNTLNGAAGADTMTGGAGSDVYTVDDLGDVTIESIDGGEWDHVTSTVTWTLAANIEVLDLSGNAAIDGTGNALHNLIYGNESANVLNGGGGDDIFIGRGGNDTYIIDSAEDNVQEDANAGTDLVLASLDHTLALNVENLTLTGTGGLSGTGNALANIITGNSAANLLDGGTGIDTLMGGAGNDIYIVDRAADNVVELAGGGIDTVQASVSVTLQAEVEQLVLTGTSATSGTGNELANTITGNSAANVLNGEAGNDTLIGASGGDTMNGGADDDTYVVDNTSDKTIEAASGGSDTVQTSISFTLQAEVEKLTLTGSSAINGTGNTLGNTITGNSAANVLNGGAGVDTLAGGAGNDTYVVDNAADKTIEVTGGGIDLVQASVSVVLQAEVENLTLTGSENINGTGNSLANVLTGNAGVNVLTGGSGSDTYVVNNSDDQTIEQVGGGLDVVQSSVNYTLQSDVENLTLTGAAAINAIGNTKANVLNGNSAANLLNGGAGGDTMVGGLGGDTYVVDNAGDQIIEQTGGGLDLVQASVSWSLGSEVENLTLLGASALHATGNAQANLITGNQAANLIDGGQGADTMVGGAGGDIYIVESSGDQIVERASGGLDEVRSSVSYTLAAEVENMALTGSDTINATGNVKDNVLVGNAAANVLNGAAGADTMTGGSGGDTYVVDNASDQTIEAIGGGLDTVQTSISWTLGSEVENLTLTGSAAINATGNTKNNAIVGNAAANTLDGGAGADTMTGGGGSDTYVVENAGDQTIEQVSGGLDSVLASVSWTLSSEVENLSLTGAGAINANGNSKNNLLIGNSAANTLNGGAGADTMTGGAGADIFDFTSTLGSDTITDFAHNGDKIRLDQSTLRVGDGDTSIEGAVSVSGPNGFSTAAELVIVTHDIAGDISATSAATAIGKADSNYAVGDTRLFVVDNGHDTAVYLFKSIDNSATVTASELTLVATLEGTSATSSTDYLFGA